MKPTSSTLLSASSTISSKEFQRLNITTIRLYRMLLRECQILQNHVKITNHYPNDGYILLQQPLDPRDWGRARLFPSNNVDNAHSPKSQTVFDFFQQSRQKLHKYSSVLLSPSPSPGLEDDISVLVAKSDISDFIRSRFREAINPNPTAEIILNRHREAIDAVRILQIQLAMSDKTCVTSDPKRGVMVTATSRCIGRATKSPMAAMKGEINNRFAYRIRVENTGLGEEGMGGKPIQLLGRFWSIEEEGEDASEPVVVKAPTTGAVGHLPVIHPGETFEYMSGCEIATRTGLLSGSFYMAQVDESTQSAMVGDAVEALEMEKGKFEMPVGPFSLVSEGGDSGDGRK